MNSLRDRLSEQVLLPLGRLYGRLNDAIWAPEATPALRERRTKIVMVSGVGVFALSLMILLLFVLPAMQIAGTPSEAQGNPPAPPAPPGPGAPGGPPAVPRPCRAAGDLRGWEGQR